MQILDRTVPTWVGGENRKRARPVLQAVDQLRSPLFGQTQPNRVPVANHFAFLAKQLRDLGAQIIEELI